MIFETKERILKDNTKVILRSPVLEDAKALLDFMRVTAAETDFLLSSGEDFNKATVENEEQWIKSHTEGDACIILAFKDGRIIGNCGMEFKRNSKAKHRGNIGITISKEYWNKGLGTILFEEMIEIARKRPDTEQIELGVIDQNNRAKHLYEKFGFKETGKIPHALKLPDGTYYDEIMMTMYLD